MWGQPPSAVQRPGSIGPHFLVCHPERSMPIRKADRHTQSKDPFIPFPHSSLKEFPPAPPTDSGLFLESARSAQDDTVVVFGNSQPATSVRAGPLCCAVAGASGFGRDDGAFRRANLSG